MKTTLLIIRLLAIPLLASGFLATSSLVAAPQQFTEELPPPTAMLNPSAAALGTNGGMSLPTNRGYNANSQVSVRIKDLTRVQGRRTNKLTGMGLVSGLNGTGSKNPVTREFALNMLERFDLRSDPDSRALIRMRGLDKTDNLSVVTVTAEVDISLHKQGNPIDVTVSTFDDASSLQGGVLMLTPLYGVDGEVYAIANGPVSVGGFSFSGEAASVQQNHPTTGRIPNGATIERDICDNLLAPLDRFRLNLTSPDLETAARMVNAINGFWPGFAKMYDAGVLEIRIPEPFLQRQNEFIALVQSIRVVPDYEARVVINERTGTIVVGKNVRLSKVAISHANLSVVTSESPIVAQPAPFSEGVTAIVPRTTIDVQEGSAPINVIDSPVTVGDLAAALNAMGVTPRDLSSIFQQLKVSGALHAKLIFN